MSPGVNGVSTGFRGGMIGGGGKVLAEAWPGVSKSDNSDRYVDINVNTLEWKCGLVIGLVSISY